MCLSLLVFAVACSTDDEETFDAPVITITSPSSSVTEITAGEEVTFSYTVDAPGVFNTTTATIEDADGADVTTAYTASKEPGATETSFTSDNILVTIPEAYAGQTLTFTVTAVDDQNATASVSIDLDITSIPAISYTEKLLYAPTQTRDSHTFFSTNLGETISSGEVVASTASSADVDFGYYYFSEANLGSPATYPSSVYDLSADGQGWGTLNATMFKETTLSSEEYMALSTSAALATAYADNTSDEIGTVEDLTEGQIILFSTDAGKEGGSKIGAIKVTEIYKGQSGNGYDNDAYLEIEVLVQP